MKIVLTSAITHPMAVWGVRRWDQMERQSYEGLQAMPVLGMAVFEQVGIRGLIDSRLDPNPQRILTPGNGTKLMVGAMYKGMGRRALYALDEDYAKAPVDLLCGAGVEASNLNARAFSRTLDDLFTLDLPDLTHDIYGIFAERYSIGGFVYNLDATNYGVNAIVVEPDKEGAAVPEFNGHAKDGKQRPVYNEQRVTDSNGIVMYSRPYDGSVPDPSMDMDTIDYLAKKLGKGKASRSTIVADSKLVSLPILQELAKPEIGFGFVSKCPDSFGEKVRDDIVYSVLHSDMDPCPSKDGWELYDTDAVVDGVSYRFVAFRTPVRNHEMEYLKVMGLKKAQKAIRALGKQRFDSREDALAALEAAKRSLVDTAYTLDDDIDKKTELRYSKRGRPSKKDVPVEVTTYTVNAEPVFSERLAEELMDDRRVRVLITNLRRSQEDMENPRDGTTADGVLRLYLGQYRIEHTFRTSKSVFDLDCVYLHNPSRVNAFGFVVSMATMISGVITTVMRRTDIPVTAESMIRRLSTLIVRHDRAEGTDSLYGNEMECDMFERCVQAMGLDETRLFG